MLLDPDGASIARKKSWQMIAATPQTAQQQNPLGGGRRGSGGIVKCVQRSGARDSSDSVRLYRPGAAVQRNYQPTQAASAEQKHQSIGNPAISYPQSACQLVFAVVAENVS